MQAKPTLSLILPTYNEARNLPILVRRLEAVFNKNKIRAEIIVVDDSSPDGTGGIADSLNRKYGNIKLITRKTREGLGIALRSGYNAALGDIILSMDSDLSIEPEDILKLLRKINEGYDLVVGSRHSTGSSYENPNLRTTIKKIVSMSGNAFTRSLIGIPVNDYSMNFRAIRRSTWKKIRTSEKRNAFLLEMIMEVQGLGGRIAEVPFSFTERKYGKSKMKLFKEVIPFLARVLRYAVEKRSQ